MRYDDPTINTPSSQGTDVFIDRGAYDRNDYAGPFAELVVPKDNDSEGRDVDATLTVVQLDSGVYASFDIVLKDGPGSSTPVDCFRLTRGVWSSLKNWSAARRG